MPCRHTHVDGPRPWLRRSTNMPAVARCAQRRLRNSNSPTVSGRNPYKLEARPPPFRGHNGGHNGTPVTE
ncbi:hypothetical protein PG996_016088 [Apiospora saccharicola]|uniref:Uncharacterized protein n=1 Tax=Apiospora saccharicola TaxID=335842 RepID=A0ABR1TN34_9PEZI